MGSLDRAIVSIFVGPVMIVVADRLGLLPRSCVRGLFEEFLIVVLASVPM